MNLKDIRIEPNESTKKLNPHIYAAKTDWSKVPVGPAPFPEGIGGVKRRIRQDTKPLMNKLELRAFEWLKRRFPGVPIRPQAKRYMLGRGIWYKPDFTFVNDRWEFAFEVKGPHAFRGGFENLKVAAHQYPEIRWALIWEEAGNFVEQEVLP